MTFCAGTTVPLPSAAVSTLTALAGAGLIVNELLVALVKPGAEAVRVLLPAFVMLKVLKVADPFAAVATVVVPFNVPPPFNVSDTFVPPRDKLLPNWSWS